MSWLQRLKAKYWDEAPPPDPVIEPGVVMFFAMGTKPRLRRSWDWLADLWEKQPLALVATCAGLLGAIAAIIRALR